ncbi:hypothetical protein QM333_35725, partial [Pseudomonas aeruginosa]|uniref:hypothetical protein n=1 Tax=Pseudomonas aeruginosa TaxID=287 RepID=UPI0024B76900
GAAHGDADVGTGEHRYVVDSVAMGSATDLAKTSADAVLLSNRLDSLVQAFRLARRTRHIIIENLAWASL